MGLVDLDAVMERLRAICLSLPEAVEVTAWGHPNFRVGKKTFAVFECYRGEWAICFKCEKATQRALVADGERFYESPYVGKHGWVSMRVRGRRLPWKQIERFVRGSYRLVAPPARSPD